MPNSALIRIVLAIAIVVPTAATSLLAQEPPPPPPGGMDPSMTLEDFVAQRMDDITEALGLTPDEQELVAPIVEEDATRKREAMEAAREQGRSGMRQLKNTIEEIDEDTLEALGEVLSEDQVQAYSEWLEEQRKGHREHFRERRGER